MQGAELGNTTLELHALWAFARRLGGFAVARKL
jgi:hypothetical protein